MMLVHGFEIEELRRDLREQGYTVARDAEGSRLFLVHSYRLGQEEPGILIAYDGKGSAFVPADRPLNRFALLSKGFGLGVSVILAELLNAALGFSGSDAGPALLPTPDETPGS